MNSVSPLFLAVSLLLFRSCCSVEFCIFPDLTVCPTSQGCVQRYISPNENLIFGRKCSADSGAKIGICSGHGQPFVYTRCPNQTDSETPDIDMKFIGAKRHLTLINNNNCGRFEVGEYAHYVQGSQSPGVIHFNDYKYFKATAVDNYEEYIDLVYLMAHEIGHVLNFAHTSDIKSVMHHQYYKYDSVFKLTESDIATAEIRYGVKSNCNEPAQQWTEYKGTARVSLGGDPQLVCVELYTAENCAGNKLVLPSYTSIEAQAERNDLTLANWEYFDSNITEGTKMSSFKLAHNCSLTWTPRLAEHLFEVESMRSSQESNIKTLGNNGKMQFQCECGCASLVFPLSHSAHNVCAVIFTKKDCGGPALFIPPGTVQLRNHFINQGSATENMWDNVTILSAAVNPHCTLHMCNSESIGFECDLAKGGPNGHVVRPNWRTSQSIAAAKLF